ncbi:MAG TPA: response regulator [Noviherbaspirillum sp.]|uniref:response regulator n=1 Tax=Noviherbaspirillum sp. TaxID=1926288 RepID=UPI002B468E51|nr:response regulator [Noviherbaspirillum sp.]HJV85389.1 response regulator [Noviherbaspirillum sp.]
MDSPVPARILVVDDEEHERKLLEDLAKEEGYLTISATNGKEALALAVTEQPNLILLDLMMPGMDGFEVTRWLKNNPATHGIPIIMATALEDVASHEGMLASGADEFINKPVDRWELSLRISKALKSFRSAAGPEV